MLTIAAQRDKPLLPGRARIFHGQRRRIVEDVLDFEESDAMLSIVQTGFAESQTMSIATLYAYSMHSQRQPMPGQWAGAA